MYKFWKDHKVLHAMFILFVFSWVGLIAWAVLEMPKRMWNEGIKITFSYYFVKDYLTVFALPFRS